MPPGTRAELIGGVVYMPSPLSDRSRRDATCDVSGLARPLSNGSRRGVRGARQRHDSSWAIYGEPQPDLHAPHPRGTGAVRPGSSSGYIVGPPELVVEIARSSRAIDLGPKKADYERAGVLEYVVVELDPDRGPLVRASRRAIRRASAGPDGLFRSEVFPGLWLDPAALFADDLDGLIAALERGLATPEHAAFVARLSRADRAP